DTSIPNTITNINSAPDSAISLSCPSHGQPDDRLSIQRIVAGCRRIIVVAQASTPHFETRRVTPGASSKGDAMLRASCQARKQDWRTRDWRERNTGGNLCKQPNKVLTKR